MNDNLTYIYNARECVKNWTVSWWATSSGPWLTVGKLYSRVEAMYRQLQKDTICPDDQSGDLSCPVSIKRPVNWSMSAIWLQHCYTGTIHMYTVQSSGYKMLQHILCSVACKEVTFYGHGTVHNLTVQYSVGARFWTWTSYADIVLSLEVTLTLMGPVNIEVRVNGA